MNRTSTIHAFFETAAREPDRVALKRRISPGRWSSMTRSEYAREVRRVARALIALGVQPGDRIALCGPNRPEWLLADLGALAAGAIPAPYYTTLSADQAGYVLDHSEAVLAVVHDANQIAKLDAVRGRLQRLRARVVMEGSAPGALNWADFVARSSEVPDSAVDERLARLTKDALATLIYTSGTTGPPKAVMISHGNLLFSAEVVREQLEFRPGDELVSYLPLCHIAEQMASIHGPSVNGYCIACCERLEELPEALREVRPTIFLGVPRVWEKIQSRLEERLSQAPPRKQALFRWAQKTALARARGERPLLYAAAEALVLRKVRAALGFGRARRLGTTAAPTPRAVLDYFESLGMPLYEVYGQSECTGAATGNTPDRRRRPDRPRRLPAHHRPQEGPVDHLRRQERVAAEHRGPAGADPRSGPRGGGGRCAQAPRRAAHARPGSCAARRPRLRIHGRDDRGALPGPALHRAHRAGGGRSEPGARFL